MSKAAQDYVLDLGKRVTRHQGHLLLVLACYHQTARETYWPSHRTLAQKLGTDERQVRRIVAELKALGILAYERGIGAGNLCDYQFPELEKRTQQPPFASEKTGQKEDKKEDNPALETPKKEDNSTGAIRNIQSQKLLQDQELQNHQTLPNPPLQGGNRVTKRDLQKVKAQIEYVRRLTCKLHPGCGRTEGGRCWGCYAERIPEQPFFPVQNDELRDACEDLLLHYEAVREALDEIQFPSLKKEPQRVAG
jgi:helix-turn-helix protein